MITEKTTLVITLENSEAQDFKSIIKELAGKTIGFKGIHNHLSRDEVKLLDKLNNKLNKKKDEEN